MANQKRVQWDRLIKSVADAIAVESEILHREKMAVKKGRTERKRKVAADTTDTTDTADIADLWRRTARLGAA